MDATCARGLQVVLIALALVSASAWTDARAETPPGWVSCERYGRLAAGDADAIVAVDALRELAPSSGVTLDLGLREPARPRPGARLEAPAARLEVDGAWLIAAPGERLGAYVVSGEGRRLHALVGRWDEAAQADAGEALPDAVALRSYEREGGGWRARGDASALPVHDAEGVWRWWAGRDARLRPATLSLIDGQWVALAFDRFTCPGGCAAYCGPLATARLYRLDAAGDVAGAGEVVALEWTDEGLVCEGCVHASQLVFIDLDQDGVIDWRLRPGRTFDQVTCERDPAREPFSAWTGGRGWEVAGAASTPIMRRFVWRAGGAVAVEAQLEDLALPDHARALRRRAQRRGRATGVALANLVAGLEHIAGAAPASERAHALLSALYASAPDAPSMDRARTLELLIGALSLIVEREAAGDPTASELRARLARLEAFGLCGGDAPPGGADVVEVRWVGDRLAPSAP